MGRSTGGCGLLRVGGGGCTVGFVAQWSGSTVAVTNSHCSGSSYGGPDGSVFYSISPQQPLGTEIYDRGFHDWCPDFFGILQFCRYSDATIVSTTGAPTAVMNRIVRYNVTNPGDSDDPVYTAFSPTNPHVVNARRPTHSGDVVYKAGARTGRTQGVVTATCKDVELLIIPFGPVIACQHGATYGRKGGDPGAPVFVWPYGPANVDLRGIHWGHYPQLTWFKTVFSPLEGIERDLGHFQGIPFGPSGGGGGGGGDCTDPSSGEPIPCE